MARKLLTATVCQDEPQEPQSDGSVPSNLYYSATPVNFQPQSETSNPETNATSPRNSGNVEESRNFNQNIYLLESIDYNKVVDSMVSQITAKLSLNSMSGMKLNRLVSNACELDDELGDVAQLHVIVTTVEGFNGDEQQIVAPIVSKLFMTALDRHRPPSTFVSQALSDAFSVAKRSLDCIEHISTVTNLNAHLWMLPCGQTTTTIKDKVMIATIFSRFESMNRFSKQLSA